MRKLVILLIFLISIQISFSIENPFIVNESHVKVIQKGSVIPIGRINELNISINIPIEDEYQKINSVKASLPYTIHKDKFGNNYITFTIKNPTGKISYTIETDLEIKRRYRGIFEKRKEFLYPNEIINSDDEKIRELSNYLSHGRTGFDRIASITKWVNENIKYDKKTPHENISASIVLREKKGVCHHYAILESAILRSVGLWASYASGIVYENGTFTPHAWVEACDNNNCWAVDPTNGEYPIDALHIKFSNSPDSRVSERTFSFTGDENSNVIEESYTIDAHILKYKTDEIVDITTSPLEKRISKGFAVFKSDIQMKSCTITRVSSSSCSLLEKEESKVTYGCKNSTLFFITKLSSDISRNIIYNCGFMVYSDMGGIGNSSIIIDPNSEYKNSVIYAEKKIIKRGEKTEIISPDSHIFTENEYLGYGNTEVSPLMNETVYSYNKGGLDSIEITVLNNIPFTAEIETPSYIERNEKFSFNVTVRNKMNYPIELLLTFENQSKNILVYSEEKITFDYTPIKGGTDVITIYVKSDNFSTTYSKAIEVHENKSIFQIIIDFFKNILGIK